jgi:tRNA-Thr(GGU) m(6)t(6)A37 methyltransferase TsaA
VEIAPVPDPVPDPVSDPGDGHCPRLFTFRAIGVVRSPFREQEGTPVQPAFAEGAEGTIELDPRYAPALADLDGFERIWVLWVADRARPYQASVVPYLDTHPRGLFATRATCRPNPIALSHLRLLGIEGSVLRVADLDILDGTPVLDLKPYVPRFDSLGGLRSGWVDSAPGRRLRADRRFEPDES